jgi:hypothetical protein
MLLIVAGGQFVRFVVKVTFEDFVWFILIFHLSYHILVRGLDVVGVFVMLMPGHCLFLGGQYHLRKLLL